MNKEATMPDITVTVKLDNDSVERLKSEVNNQIQSQHTGFIMLKLEAALYQSIITREQFQPLVDLFFPDQKDQGEVVDADYHEVECDFCKGKCQQTTHCRPEGA